MAVTVAEVERPTSLGSYWEKIVDVTFDSSYPTGGEALSAATLGFNKVLAVQAAPAAGFVFSYDYTNSKLKAFWVDTTTDGAAMAEVVDTTDLQTVTARLVVKGR